MSGFSSLKSAISIRLSLKLSSPTVSLINSISLICLTAASIVLLRLAVSQFTFLLTSLLIPLRIMTLYRFICETTAPIRLRVSVILFPSFMYTTKLFFLTITFASRPKKRSMSIRTSASSSYLHTIS